MYCALIGGGVIEPCTFWLCFLLFSFLCQFSKLQANSTSILYHILNPIFFQFHITTFTPFVRRSFQYVHAYKRDALFQNFGQSQNMSKPLTYRPSSSVEAGSRSGILRHVKSSKENLRTDRPRTSHVSLERSKASSPHVRN